MSTSIVLGIAYEQNVGYLHLWGLRLRAAVQQPHQLLCPILGSQVHVESNLTLTCNIC